MAISGTGATGATTVDPAKLDVGQTVLALVAAKAGHPVSRSDSLTLLDIDSVATAELSLEIEKTLAVRVDEQIMDVETVGDLIDYVEERR